MPRVSRARCPVTPDTLPIDRRFRGVGRIHRASGTTDNRVRSKIERMLQALHEDGRLDILRAIRDGNVSFLQVLDCYRRRALAELPVGDTMPLVSVAMTAWIKDVTPDYSKKHVDNLKTAQRYFEKHDATARVADLPRVLEALRKTLGAKHPTSFNLARASALTFARSTLKRSHAIYLGCLAVEVRPVKKRAPKPPVTPDQMRAMFPKPEGPGYDVIDAIAWAMVTTGMGSEEYWGRWHTRADRVHIDGTKRGGRVRDVPLIRAPATPKLSRDRFQRRFREREKSITPYDLRRTYAQWLESAGIPRARRRVYMGHGTKDVTDLYEQHEIAEYLAADAAKLIAFLAPKPTTKQLEVME